MHNSEPFWQQVIENQLKLPSGEMDFIDPQSLKIKSGPASSILLDPEVPMMSSRTHGFLSQGSVLICSISSLPMASGLVVFSWPLQKEENVLFIQDSSNINRRIRTHWPWLLWPMLPGIPELRTHWSNLFYLWS